MEIEWKWRWKTFRFNKTALQVKTNFHHIPFVSASAATAATSTRLSLGIETFAFSFASRSVTTACRHEFHRRSPLLRFKNFSKHLQERAWLSKFNCVRFRFSGKCIEYLCIEHKTDEMAYEFYSDCFGDCRFNGDVRIHTVCFAWVFKCEREKFLFTLYLWMGGFHCLSCTIYTSFSFYFLLSDCYFSSLEIYSVNISAEQQNLV